VPYPSFWPGRVWFGRRFRTLFSYRRIGSHTRLKLFPSFRIGHRGLVLASFDDRLLSIPMLQALQALQARQVSQVPPGLIRYRSTHRINIFHVSPGRARCYSFFPQNMDPDLLAVLLDEDDVLAVGYAVVAPIPLNAPQQQGRPPPPRVNRARRQCSARKPLVPSQRPHRALRMAATGR
jgi:hypothetical protein